MDESKKHPKDNAERRQESMESQPRSVDSVIVVIPAESTTCPKIFNIVLDPAWKPSRKRCDTPEGVVQQFLRWRDVRDDRDENIWADVREWIASDAYCVACEHFSDVVPKDISQRDYDKLWAKVWDVHPMPTESELDALILQAKEILVPPSQADIDLELALRGDLLARRWTAWFSFQDLLDAEPPYCLNLSVACKREALTWKEKSELRELADLYDHAMKKRGDARRSIRAGFMAIL